MGRDFSGLPGLKSPGRSIGRGVFRRAMPKLSKTPRHSAKKAKKTAPVPKKKAFRAQTDVFMHQTRPGHDAGRVAAKG